MNPYELKRLQAQLARAEAVGDRAAVTILRTRIQTILRHGLRRALVAHDVRS